VIVSFGFTSAGSGETRSYFLRRQSGEAGATSSIVSTAAQLDETNCVWTSHGNPLGMRRRDAKIGRNDKFVSCAQYLRPVNVARHIGTGRRHIALSAKRWS
jgi:hypothetical protein